jgi:hypothetical protein
MALAVSNAVLQKNSAPVPYVRVANLGHENFQSAASSDWLYQQADTAAPTITVQMGCPVSGILLVEAESQLPSVRYLTDIGDVKYRLAEVLTVAVENAENQFVAVEPKHGWFGYGESEEKALRQFSSALVEQLEILKERQDELSDSLRSELAQLSQLVVPSR